MRYSRIERKQHAERAVAEAMSGSGLYIYENRDAHGDLTLPRPTKTGMRTIAPLGRFQGDDYYMQFVKTGMLRLIEVLKPKEEIVEQVLLLDQPETVTVDGAVEQVVITKDKVVLKEEKNKKITETTEAVLLNEGPVDGITLV